MALDIFRINDACPVVTRDALARNLQLRVNGRGFRLSVETPEYHSGFDKPFVMATVIRDPSIKILLAEWDECRVYDEANWLVLCGRADWMCDKYGLQRLTKSAA